MSYRKHHLLCKCVLRRQKAPLSAEVRLETVKLSGRKVPSLIKDISISLFFDRT